MNQEDRRVNRLEPSHHFARHARVQVVDGVTYYSPNCSRTLGHIPPTLDQDGTDLNPFRPHGQSVCDVRIWDLQQPRRWSTAFGWLAFLPLRPSYKVFPLQCLDRVRAPVSRLRTKPNGKDTKNGNKQPGAKDESNSGQLNGNPGTLRWALPKAQREDWLRLDDELYRSIHHLKQCYGIPMVLPFRPYALGYYDNHSQRHIARAQASTSRAWFSVWIGALSYAIRCAQEAEQSSRHLQYSKYPEWMALLVANGFPTTWTDGIGRSFVTIYDSPSPRVGCIVDLFKPSSTQPSIHLLIEGSIPVWYRWGREEMEMAQTNPDLASFAPQVHLLQQGTASLINNPTLLYPSNESSSGSPVQILSSGTSALGLSEGGAQPSRPSNDPLVVSLLPPSSLESLHYWTPTSGKPVPGLQPNESVPSWVPHFRKVETRRTQMLSTETATQRSARLNRTRTPATATAHVYEWVPSEMSASLADYVREEVNKRSRVDMIELYGEKQKIYDPVFNTWDCCSLWGPSDEGSESDDLDYLYGGGSPEGQSPSLPPSGSPPRPTSQINLMEASSGDWPTRPQAQAGELNSSESAPTCSAPSLEIAGTILTDHTAAPTPILPEGGEAAPEQNCYQLGTPTPASPAQSVLDGDRPPTIPSRSPSPELAAADPPPDLFAPAQNSAHTITELEATMATFYGFQPPPPDAPPAPVSEKMETMFFRMLGSHITPQTEALYREGAHFGFHTVFFSAISGKRFPPNGIWDIGSSSIAPLAFNPRLPLIKELSVTERKGLDEGLIDDVDRYFLLEPPSPTVSWKLAVLRPRHALLLTRLPQGLSEPDIAFYLAQRGIPFRLLYPSNLVPRPRLIPPLRKEIPKRPFDHRFTKVDYESYMNIRQTILEQPHAKAALRRGGLLWRLALSHLDMSCALQPMEHTGSALSVPAGDGEVWKDDSLSLIELDLICGAYECVFDDGSARALKSWWPLVRYYEKDECGENYGRWCTRREEWYAARLALIEVGDDRGRPLGYTEWKSSQHGTAPIRKFHIEVDKQSLDFLRQHRA